MTLPHSDFNGILCAARFDNWSPDIQVAYGRIYEESSGKLEDGSLACIGYIDEKHWVSDGEWVVRVRNNIYHVFEVGFKNAEGMPIAERA